MGTTVRACNIGTCKLRVPIGSVAAYRTAEVWKDFGAIEEIEGSGISVTGVSLNVETAELNVGETLQLAATVEPLDATNQNITWSSSAPAIATVDETTGLITAVSTGTVTITVTTEEGGFTATCEVTVIDGSGIDDNTLTGITVYGNGNTVYIVNKNSVPLKSVQITDILGRVVYSGKAGSSVTIPVNGASGIYIVRLLSDDNKTSSTKVGAGLAPAL